MEMAEMNKEESLTEIVRKRAEARGRKLYAVNIKETYSRTVIVEANDPAGAGDLTWDLMGSGEIVLDLCGDFYDSSVDVRGPAGDDDIEWYGNRVVYKEEDLRY